jgi:hypothetical protein
MMDIKWFGDYRISKNKKENDGSSRNKLDNADSCGIKQLLRDISFLE